MDDPPTEVSTRFVAKGELGDDLVHVTRPVELHEETAFFGPRGRADGIVATHKFVAVGSASPSLDRGDQVPDSQVHLHANFAVFPL